ncbi:MAG: DUF5665 domain-containing protein [Candidatus Saccharimonadales bacterium]
MRDNKDNNDIESINKEPSSDKDYQRLGKTLVQTMIKDNILVSYNWRRFILINLTRGLLVGFGSVIGATLLVAVAIWLLNTFGALPVIGEWFDALGGAIENGNVID